MQGSHVVLGFSCAGKSTFIRALSLNAPGYKAAVPVYGHMIVSGEKQQLVANDLFHLDISAVTSNNAAPAPMRVEDHPCFPALHRSESITKFLFLLAPETEIRARIQTRQHVGIGFGRDNAVGTYPRQHKLQNMSLYSLRSQYVAWMEYAQSVNAECEFFHSVDGGFRQLIDKETALHTLAG